MKKLFSTNDGGSRGLFRRMHNLKYLQDISNYYPSFYLSNIIK